MSKVVDIGIVFSVVATKSEPSVVPSIPLGFANTKVTIRNALYRMNDPPPPFTWLSLARWHNKEYATPHE